MLLLEISYWKLVQDIFTYFYSNSLLSLYAREQKNLLKFNVHSKKYVLLHGQLVSLIHKKGLKFPKTYMFKSITHDIYTKLTKNSKEPTTTHQKQVYVEANQLAKSLLKNKGLIYKNTTGIILHSLIHTSICFSWMITNLNIKVHSMCLLCIASFAN